MKNNIPFTYYTIIGRDPKLIKDHLTNVTEYAGFNKLECEKKLLVLVYRNPTIPQLVTNEIIEICTSFGAQVELYDEPVTEFITNLYACWNLGYELALDGLVFRGGSDQVFSKDSFIALYEEGKKAQKEKIILQANTIENAHRIMEMNARSRHMLMPLGNTFDEFDWKKFEAACTFINSDSRLKDKSLVSIEDALAIWNYPTFERTTLGILNRCDGCSWLMRKSDWEQFGPLPVMESGITGDVVIHDRLQVNGYISYIVRDCITYHFVRGESKDIQ